jgi:hypothetical protein
MREVVYEMLSAVIEEMKKRQEDKGIPGRSIVHFGIPVTEFNEVASALTDVGMTVTVRWVYDPSPGICDEYIVTVDVTDWED